MAPPQMETPAVRLAAFAGELATYLNQRDLRHLRCCSRLVWAALEPRSSLPERAQCIVSLMENLDELARDLQDALKEPQPPITATRRRYRKRFGNVAVRLRPDQLRPLVRDLVLVGLGVRGSCLVDTCQLVESSVLALLLAFRKHGQWRAYGMHRLTAVVVSGNVFFVNPSEFARAKCLDVATNLASTVLVDASGELKAPELLSSGCSTREQITRSLGDAIATLTHRVVASVVPTADRPSIIQLDASHLSSSAIAGSILNYPVLYHVSGTSSTQDHDPFWSSSVNCLGMCPLLVFQTSIVAKNATACDRLVLQEFSLPQQLSSRRNALTDTILTRCTNALERAVGDTELLSIHVDVSERTLPQVAL